MVNLTVVQDRVHYKIIKTIHKRIVEQSPKGPINMDKETWGEDGLDSTNNKKFCHACQISYAGGKLSEVI